ncbi:MAG: O-antigen ligase family protein, partial [Planctomycetes bacterium]|nr:O-antigen ligase family protein [Planctomycetota bacterium]
PLKFMLPALLLFDASRTRRDVSWACLCIGGFVVIDALLIMKRLSPMVLLGDANYHALRHRVGAVTGYHPNDMALMLVITFWSIIGFLKVLKGHRWLRVAAWSGAAACALATGLCHSRSGFVAFLGVGLLVGAVGRTRVALLVLAVVLAAATVSPSIATRAMEGVTESQTDAGDEEDALTAGRTSIIWPIVIEGIAERPLIGHGREACWRALGRWSKDRYDVVISHPHNAYLEILLDGGVISLAVVMGLFGYLLFISVRLIRRGRDTLSQAVGNAGLATLGAWMIMGISGQHFYASENTIALFCVLAVVARVYADASDRLGLRPDGLRRGTARCAGRRRRIVPQGSDSVVSGRSTVVGTVRHRTGCWSAKEVVE